MRLIPLNILRAVGSAIINNSVLVEFGELIFSTDTKEVFVGDVLTTSKILANGVTVNVLALRPVAGARGRLFFAEDARKLYIDTGSTWLDIMTETVINSDYEVFKYDSFRGKYLSAGKSRTLWCNRTSTGEGFPSMTTGYFQHFGLAMTNQSYSAYNGYMSPKPFCVTKLHYNRSGAAAAGDIVLSLRTYAATPIVYATGIVVPSGVLNVTLETNVDIPANTSLHIFQETALVTYATSIYMETRKLYEG